MAQKAKAINISAWPSSFKRLMGIFSHINTQLTFLSSHSRNTIPTFELLHKLNNDITELDLSIIAYLLPPGNVAYEYVDENQIQLSFMEKITSSKDSGYRQTKPQSVFDVYEEAASQGHEKAQPNKFLLIFDFRDTKIDGVGAVIKGAKRRKTPPADSADFFLSSRELRLTNLSPQQLQNIISARNEKFKVCVSTYLSSFTLEELENEDDLPMRKLKDVCESLVPQCPTFQEPLEALKDESALQTTSGRPHLNRMISALKEKPFYRNQICAIKTLNETRESQVRPLVDDPNDPIIHPDLKRGLSNYMGLNIENGLYSHQTEALEALLFNQDSKDHLVVSTSTSSGKSLIYQIPVLNSILWDISQSSNVHQRFSTAFFIFPTKALAQDQMRAMKELILNICLPHGRDIIVSTFDGDTSMEERRRSRKFADIIFTNPDTIHTTILPSFNGVFQDGVWAEFLRNLRYIVIDELHVYKGTFGIHVSYIMSRLMRIRSELTADSMIQNTLQLISCSATILNPVSHFRTVCSIPKDQRIIHVVNDGSPQSEKKLVIWNPPPLMNKRGESHKNSSRLTSDKLNMFIPRENIICELARILLHLLSNINNVKIIVFCPIRVVCEMIMKEVRALIKSPQFNLELENEIMAYRGGYSKEDRRLIEKKMFSGNLRAIIATNALELGIDLSDLDIVLNCGFPLLKLNLHQQMGRAGRGKDSNGSLAILVCGQNPIDQYYLKHPEDLCTKTYEDLCVESLIEIGLYELILAQHLQCAAFEYPITLDNDSYWFSHVGSIQDCNTFIGICRKNLYFSDGKYRTHPKYLPWPANCVSIRAIEENNYAVVDITNGKNLVIEEVEELRTSFTLYEGAIFLHQGFPYLVKEFNPESKFAKVERVNVDWITQQRDFSDVDPIEIEYLKCLVPPTEKTNKDIPAFFGNIRTTIIVFGYFKVNRRGELLEAVEVKNPPVIINSKGFWIDIPRAVLDIVKSKSLSTAGGIHAAQHAIMNILPLFISGGATTNPNTKFTSTVGEGELMTECKAPEKEFAHRQTKRKRPARLIFYDSRGGSRGSGISAKTFELIDDIIYATYMRVRECECEYGCPSCVAGSFCKEMLLVMSKPAAILILAGLLSMNLKKIAQEVDDGPEPNMPKIDIETIEPVKSHVKLSKDVHILEERKLGSSPFVIKKEDINE